MNILVDELPNSVMVVGREVEINSDFRTAILYELLMMDREIEMQEKVETALSLFYPSVPGDTKEAMDAMLWFYSCGKKEGNNEGAKGRKRQERIYSYDEDDLYIYAAFLGQYGIDLNQIDYLHWWKFKAMFQSLKSDHEIVKIMGYRAIEITSDMTQSQKDFYRKMKILYQIPLAKTEQEKISAIEDALLHGGDLSGIL